MPEVGDFQLHLQGVGDLLLQRSSNQGCFSRCYTCGSGVKSELFNACLDCREVYQDVKPGDAKAPPLVEAPFWRATEDILPAPIVATVPEDHVTTPFAPPSNRVTRPRSSPSDDSSRHHLALARSPRRSATSPYRTECSQRGRPPNGSRKGPRGFRGVRQRKGVRGYLVEIRPPKWKRTIWLGTYNSDREAAGAYDAGVFYTNKKTKYNFPDLHGTFPPLPPQLRLDNANDSDAIKVFVQHEARLAAEKVRSLPPAESSATSTVTTPTPTTSSEECSQPPHETGTSEPGPIVIPLYDDDYWFTSLLDEYPNLSQQSVWQQMGAFELKQEISLDPEGLL